MSRSVVRFAMAVRCAMALCATLTSALAVAQPLGTFRWQMQPYCNVVTVSVTESGGVYTLDGHDDQCGADTRAPATGTAVLNPDGTVEIGLHIVTSPDAVPLHVAVPLSVATLGGTWRDSAGRSGSFVLTPGAATPGSPRPPAGAIGAGSVNPAEVQLRVEGACPAGSAMVGVNENGSVACQPAGTVTGVAAGPGLTGGGSTGPVALQLDLAHVRSELHLREDSLDNLAIGDEALQAPGDDAAANVALGGRALQRMTSGGGNTAIGFGTLSRSTVGHTNTAVGTASLAANESGYANVAVGYNALTTSIGHANVGIGYYAGYFAASGSNNIHLGSTGAESDAQTIRIGGSQTRTFLAGVRGITTGAANAVPVVVDSAGQLGTISSSRRTKTDIAALGDAAARIHDLRPVRFRYKANFADGSSPVQYGLIAEEVERVLPELVAYGTDGEPETVMYHILPTMLLAEVQRLERERADLVRRMEAQERAQAERIGQLERSLGELRDQLSTGGRGDRTGRR